MKTHFCKEATRPFSLQGLLNGFEAHIWALIKVITFYLCVGKIPWRREMLPTPVSGLENSKDCINSWVGKRWTQLSDFDFHFQAALVLKNLPAIAGDLGDTGQSLGRCPGGGHGNPLQCSCLENPMDRRAWRAIVHGVRKSRARLKGWAVHTCMIGPLCCTAEITTL